MDRERVKDMDAREHIVRRVGGLNHPDQRRKEAVCGIRRDAEIRAVREDGADEERDSHAERQKEAEVCGLVLIRPAEVEQRGKDVDEPEQIGNNEDRQKGNQLIQAGVHDQIVTGNCRLQIVEPEDIEDGIEKNDREKMVSREHMGGRVIRFVLIQIGLLYARKMSVAIPSIVTCGAQKRREKVSQR